MPSVASSRFHSKALRQEFTVIRLLCSILLITTFCLFSPPLSHAENPREVHVWAFEFPPGIFKDKDGVVQGWFVDLLNEIGRQEKLRFVFEFGEWSEGLERARRDQIDLLTSVAWTDERATYLDYGKTPILTVWGQLYSQENSTITRLEEIEGQTVAVMRQDYNAHSFAEKFNLPVSYMQVDSFDDVFKALEARTADLGIVSRLVAENRAHHYRVRHTGINVTPFDIFFATPKGRDLPLLATLDQYLDAWRKQDNSFYYQSHQKWRSRADQTELISIIPSWVWNALAVVLTVTVFTIVWVVVLRRQVRRATAEVLLREQRLQMIVDIVQTQAENTKELLDKTLAEAVKLTASRFGYIYFYAEETRLFTLQSWSEKVMPACNIPEFQTTYRLDETGIWGEVVRQRKPVIINDFHAANPLKKGYPHGHVPLDRFMSIPVFSDGRIVGAVGVANKAAPYERADVLQLTLLIEGIWKIIDRVEITTELRKKNAEMARFLYTASHDLKSPLVTIKAFLGFLTTDMAEGDNEKVATDLAHIHQAAERMGRLLDDLLDIARIGHMAENAELLSAQEIIASALAATQAESTLRGIEVVVHKADIGLKGTRQRLLEIWENLLENAIKYMGAQPAPRIELGMESDSGETRFYVRDNGTGIDPRYHEKIFGLFERLDHSVPGTGLGLALVLQIVEHYGGRIWVESAGVGHGSCFYFTLPRVLR